MNTKEIVASGEKTKSTKSDSIHAQRKRVIITFLVLAAIFFASLIVVAKVYRHRFDVAENSTVVDNGAKGENASSLKRKITPAMPSPNQFVTPEDAAEEGQLAMAVENLDGARKQIFDIAGTNGGNIYSTNITYVSGNVKKGIIVVQTPADQFKKTFDVLKSVGAKVFQESTQKIQPRSLAYEIPMVQNSLVGVKNPGSESQDAGSSDQTVATDIEEGENQASISKDQTQPEIAPINFPQIVQDKGYIRVIFVDYGENLNAVLANSQRTSNVGQKMVSRTLVAFAIKTLFVLVLFLLLIFMLIKLFKSFKKNKTENKSKTIAANAARKISKSGKRVTRLKKK